MTSAQAGTIESMDCLVNVVTAPPGSGRKIVIAGSGAARFKTAMERKINEVLDETGIRDVELTVQDNGALDVVLGARVEAAIQRLGGDVDYA